MEQRAIVDRLESSAAGCRWLLDQWAALRAILDRGESWSNDDLDTAVCLLGLDPVRREEAVWDYLLRRQPDPADLEEHRLRLGRQLDETITSEGTRDRVVLGRIVDRAVARLDPLLSAHTLRAAAGTAELDQRLAFDADEDGERLRRYHFGCEQSLRRTLETLLKLHRGATGQRRGAGDEEGRIAAAPTEPDEATTPCGPARPSRKRSEEIHHRDTEITEKNSLMPSPAIQPLAPCDIVKSCTAYKILDVSNTETLPVSPSGDGPEIPVAPTSDSQPPLPNEATAPTALVVAEPSEQNEAIAPAVDHSRPQNEAIAPAGGAGRPVPIGPVTAVALLALVFFAGIASAAEWSADVLGPDPSPPGHGATEKARTSAAGRAGRSPRILFAGCHPGATSRTAAPIAQADARPPLLDPGFNSC